MKKLIILLLLTLTSFISFSQTATGTVSVSKDSIVVLPKQLVTYMVQDLIRYDGLKEQMSVIDNNVSLLKKQVESQEKINEDLRSKLNICRATNDEYKLMDETNIQTIETLKFKSSKIKRQRNALLLFSFSAVIGLLVK